MIKVDPFLQPENYSRLEYEVYVTQRYPLPEVRSCLSQISTNCGIAEHEIIDYVEFGPGSKVLEARSRLFSFDTVYEILTEYFGQSVARVIDGPSENMFHDALHPPDSDPQVESIYRQIQRANGLGMYCIQIEATTLSTERALPLLKDLANDPPLHLLDSLY